MHSINQLAIAEPQIGGAVHSKLMLALRKISGTLNQTLSPRSLADGTARDPTDSYSMYLTLPLSPSLNEYQHGPLFLKEDKGAWSVF